MCTCIQKARPIASDFYVLLGLHFAEQTGYEELHQESLSVAKCQPELLVFPEALPLVQMGDNWHILSRM